MTSLAIAVLFALCDRLLYCSFSFVLPSYSNQLFFMFFGVNVVCCCCDFVVVILNSFLPPPNSYFLLINSPILVHLLHLFFFTSSFHHHIYNYFIATMATAATETSTSNAKPYRGMLMPRFLSVFWLLIFL